MRTEWQVGVLRSGAENVAWTAGGHAPSWTTARSRALAALRALAEDEDRLQEYRMHVGDVPVLLWPGLDTDGRLDLSGIDTALPLDRDDPAASW